MTEGEKTEKLDAKLGQETAGIGRPGGDSGGSATPSDKEMCVCCGKLKATPGFKYCFGCHKKWLAVHDDFRSAGFNEDIARKRATKAYPPRYDKSSPWADHP